LEGLDPLTSLLQLRLLTLDADGDPLQEVVDLLHVVPALRLSELDVVEQLRCHVHAPIVATHRAPAREPRRARLAGRPGSARRAQQIRMMTKNTMSGDRSSAAMPIRTGGTTDRIGPSTGSVML